MPTIETNTRKVIARLKTEGWINEGGAEHDVYKLPGRPAVAVPRHRELSKGVARQIAKAAGWL